MIKLLINLIPCKKIRHRARHRYIEYTKFKNLPRYNPDAIRQNSVLIIEPNPWHGEIIPGFAKYFQDLGYNVDIFMRYENYMENPFVNYTENPPRIFICNLQMLRQWCRNLMGYEHVLISTAALWDNGFRGTFQKYLGHKIKCRGQVMMVEHSPQIFLDLYNLRPVAATARLFSLSAYKNCVRQLNPHYYGTIESSSVKHNPVRFVIVGSIHPDAKNHNMIIDAFQEILNSGNTNFHIDIIGRGAIKIPSELSKNVTIHGRLKYAQMFKLIANTDFIIAGLDQKNYEHLRYANGTTTGCLQSALGFNKPLIINSLFAACYGLNNKNSILYKNDKLNHAITTALNMSENQYQNMKRELSIIQQKIYNKSLQNLSATLSKKITARENKNFAMYCKSYSGDYDAVKQMLGSFHQYNITKIHMYLSVPESELEIFREFETDTVTIISDESYAGKYMAMEPINNFAIGYMNQEICKLNFWRTKLCDNYLVVDSDAVFIRNFCTADFMADEKTPYTVLVQDKDLNIEPEYQEFWDQRQEAIQKIYMAVGLDDRRYRTCHNMQIMNAKVLKSLYTDFMLPNKYNYCDLMKIAPFEFTWYNAWFQKCGIIPEIQIEPLFKMFHIPFQYNICRVSNINISDMTRSYVGIVLNGNWAGTAKYKNPDKASRKLNKQIKSLNIKND